jgi:hypothetical protein
MSHIPSVVRAATLGCSLAVVVVPTDRAAAQTLGGQVVQLDTKKPLAGAAVALVDDSARDVASTSASSEGAFYLDAPAAGIYRLVVLVSGGSFVSPDVQLDAGKTIEKYFSVPDVPSTFGAALFARDVTKPAAPVPGISPPTYPAALAETGVRATISTMFVVSEVGQPDLTTFRVLNTAADERFVNAIREALQRTRFVPARKNEDWVPQVVQYTFDFGLAGDPERGEVVIRPPAVAAASAPARSHPDPVEPKAPPVKTMYIVASDELSKPEIEQMNLSDALHLLRPRLYGPTRNNARTSIDEPPVYVNNVRVEGMASLRNITAGNVQEVRYWKREEAAMRFGMDYPYAITVTMRPDRS